jgi:hypothetical protein
MSWLTDYGRLSPCYEDFCATTWPSSALAATILYWRRFLKVAM